MDRSLLYKQGGDHLQTLPACRTWETFVVLFLNGRNALISSDIIFEGTLTQSSVFPREIFEEAMLRNAASIIVGHNHPSG